MAVELNQDSHPGDLYIDENGQLWRLLHYCTRPTATMEHVVSGTQVSGAVGSRNLEQFTRVREKGLAVIGDLVPRLAEELIAEKERRLEAMERLLRAKHAEFFEGEEGT
jgi:hypothetical protein